MRISSYIIGGAALIFGSFILVLPLLIVFFTNDLKISQFYILPIISGLVLGLPLIVSGITLIRKRYRISLYTALLTGLIYISIPIVLQIYDFYYYIPGIVVLTIILTIKMFSKYY